MARRPSRRDLSTGILVVLLAGVLISNTLGASATHQPADKFAAASSNVRDIDGVTGEDIVILRETARVSTTSDLALAVTSECSLITSVTTGDEDDGQTVDTAEARAAIQYYITIDDTTPEDDTDNRVPVSTVDTDSDTEGTQLDDGTIVFCDRLYRQTASDAEGDGDIDRMDTYEETRSAHGFNWLALNVGSEYDDPSYPPGTGNNIVVIEVHAQFVESTMGDAAADALVGRTSLMVDPTHASVHESVDPGTP